MAQRIILVMIIAVIAGSSILYLWNETDHKIGQYFSNSKMDGIFRATESQRQFIFNTVDYSHKKIQNSIVYSAIIMLVALGLTAAILKPKRVKRIDQDNVQSS